MIDDEYTNEEEKHDQCSNCVHAQEDPDLSGDWWCTVYAIWMSPQQHCPDHERIY